MKNQVFSPTESSSSCDSYFFLSSPLLSFHLPSLSFCFLLLPSPNLFSYSIVFIFLSLNEASQAGVRSILGNFWERTPCNHNFEWRRTLSWCLGLIQDSPFKPHIPPGLPFVVAPASSIREGRWTLVLSGTALGSLIWIPIVIYPFPFYFNKFLSSESSRIPSIHIARNPDLSHTWINVHLWLFTDTCF